MRPDRRAVPEAAKGRSIIVLGVDPGLTAGALSVVDAHHVVFVADLPVHQVAAGKKTRVELDLGTLRDMLAKGLSSNNRIGMKESGQRQKRNERIRKPDVTGRLELLL